MVVLPLVVLLRAREYNQGEQSKGLVGVKGG
jgi:hypothetical protein